MFERLLLPINPILFSDRSDQSFAADCINISNWFDKRIKSISAIWQSAQLSPPVPPMHDPLVLAAQIFALLTHHSFNFQSRGKVGPLRAGVEENLLRQISRNVPIKFFFLYNGGYRASPMPQGQSLIFQPDQTEFMLLYQIAQLDEQVKAIYAPGIEFFIVVNNGVAWWVNNIELEATQGYTHDLRQMIDAVGGAQSVRVLLQSELPGFSPNFCWNFDVAMPQLSLKDQRIVERFLGRSCTHEEAAYRAAMYTRAETHWGHTLQALVRPSGAIVLRQIAHLDMLSFRPFPGGAIRIQNGSLGFWVRGSELVPKLITAETMAQQRVHCVPYQINLPRACGEDRQEFRCA